MFSNYCHSLQMIDHQSFWHRRKPRHKKHSKYLKNNNNIEITEKLINKKVVDANLRFTIYLFEIKVYKVCLIEVYKTFK
jgi:hypothetical protein